MGLFLHSNGEPAFEPHGTGHVSLPEGLYGAFPRAGPSAWNTPPPPPHTLHLSRLPRLKAQTRHCVCYQAPKRS